MGKLDVAGIFGAEARKLAEAREACRRLHGTNDMRAAGNEVEGAVRDFFRRRLATKYHVAHGHVVDAAGTVSPQLDIIISDNLTLPSLLRAGDGTEYVPFETVYAVGEIKSTYYKSATPLAAFSDTLGVLRDGMTRQEVVNTAYRGELSPNTDLRDAILSPGGNRVLNCLFSFTLFVGAGDFAPADVESLFAARRPRQLPNLSVFLDKGVLLRAREADNRFEFNRYPEHSEHPEEAWYFTPFPAADDGSCEGNHLAFAYFCLLQHLGGSRLEPPSLSPYLSRLMVGRKSLLTRLGG